MSNPTQERPDLASTSEKDGGLWRDLALQFDGHRIEALSLLRYVSEARNCAEAMGRIGEIKPFLAKPPLSGEAVLANRLHPPAESSGSPSTSGVGVTDEYVPQVIHYDGEGDPYWQFVERDTATVTGEVFAANVEMLMDFDGNVIGFNIYDPAAPPSDPSRDTQPALLSTDETKEGGNGYQDRVERALRTLSYPVSTEIRQRGWDCKTDADTVEFAVSILRGEE